MKRRPLPDSSGQLLGVGEPGGTSSHDTTHPEARVAIIFDLTPAQFRERLFEKEYWLGRGALPAEDRFGVPEVERLLNCIEPVSPGLQLFHHGRIAEDEYSHWTMAEGGPCRRLDARFRALLAGGATLVLNGVEERSLSARRLCEAVRRLSGFPTRSNLYLSFGGDGSFGAHWDTHDVAALQLVGRKRWRVSPPTFPLPLPGQTSARSGLAAPAPPQLDLLLEAGDVLYLPRGWWHDVMPLQEPSVHLSVGIYTPSVLDALTWLSHRVLPHELAARRSAVEGAATCRDLSTVVDALKTSLGDGALMDRLRRELLDPMN